MYQQSFEKASLWAIFWRSMLALFGVTFIAGFLILFFSPSQVIFISLLSDILLYFLLYKIVVYQMKRQSLSVDALSRSDNKHAGELLKISGFTLLVATAATTFMSFFITALTFIPTLFDLFVPYYIRLISQEEVPFLYIFIIGVFVAPLVEEIIFRGYILNKWADKYSVISGVVLSSLLFMIFHIQSFFIPQLLVGLLCGLVYVKYTNLFYAIFTHSLYNFFVLLPSLLVSTDVSQESETIASLTDTLTIDYVISSVVFLISIGGVIWIYNNLFHSIKGKQSPYAENLTS